jgi:hypothetical protein
MVEHLVARVEHEGERPLLGIVDQLGSHRFSSGYGGRGQR